MTNFIGIYLAVLLALATFFGLKHLFGRRKNKSGNYRNFRNRYPNRKTFRPKIEPGKDSRHDPAS